MVEKASAEITKPGVLCIELIEGGGQVAALLGSGGGVEANAPDAVHCGCVLLVMLDLGAEDARVLNIQKDRDLIGGAVPDSVCAVCAELGAVLTWLPDAGVSCVLFGFLLDNMACCVA